MRPPSIRATCTAASSLFGKCAPLPATLALATLIAVLGAGSPAAAQGIGDDPTMGDHIADAVQSAARLAGQKAAANRQFAQARRAYVRARRSGEGLEEAEEELAGLLFGKDLHFLGLYIAVGPNSTRPQAMAMLTGGPLDDGIRPSARDEFDAWVNAVRSELGARSENQLIMVTSQQKVLDALAAAEEEYLEYKRARDEAEYREMGIS